MFAQSGGSGWEDNVLMYGANRLYQGGDHDEYKMELDLRFKGLSSLSMLDGSTGTGMSRVGGYGYSMGNLMRRMGWRPGMHCVVLSGSSWGLHDAVRMWLCLWL
ncbi:hypothetical protein EYC80_008896 [Monilinia laxa]|uniref:Uncharacterized protein n=1 Tax=Monilinia laxa TaxID=61186 RepID=A0A5N6K1R9_MONLA|nr:hypothetical protein EYC80_008896 [Monilinia laxa]